jgi:RNA polymerase sigma-70 factor (ECF subfamily)
MAELGRGATALSPLSGDQRQWLTDLYLANFPRVLRLCRRMLRNPDDAEDAAHEVFLRAIGPSQLRSAGEEITPWLLTVARNHCLDVLRRRQRLGRVLVTLSADGDATPDPEAQVADREVVAAIFEQLRRRERHALWQSAVERRPLAAIAYDLRLSYMATAQLLHRARKHAAAVAARLAAIFGLWQLGRALRRASLARARLVALVRQPSMAGFSLSVHHLLAIAAIAAVPVVLASVPSSSSAQNVPAVPPSLSALPGVTTLAPGTSPPDPQGVLKQVTPLLSPPGVPLPSPPGVPLPSPITLPSSLPLPSPLSSAVGTVQQTVGPLPVPTP